MTLAITPQVANGRWVAVYHVDVSTSGKTNVYDVRAKADDEFLGSVYWYGHWRQYIFHPSVDTIWNAACLVEVSDFLRQTNESHRISRAKVKTEAKTGDHSD